MIRVGALVWSLFAALIITVLSLFYNQEGKGGYPFSVTYLEETSSAYGAKSTDSRLAVERGTRSAEIESQPLTRKFSWSLFIADLFFWWLIFSILLVLLKNSVFDSFQEEPKKSIEAENSDKK